MAPCWANEMKTFVRRIKRRETPLYNFLFHVAKKITHFSIPYSRFFHGILYHEWQLRRSLWHAFWRVIYYEPMFKSQCASVGKKFRMEYAGNGSAKIYGNLSLHFGDNVRIFDNTRFAGLKVHENPELYIGDNTYIGPLVRFMVGKRITVGQHCLITSRIITDNPGHPIDDVLARMSSGGGSPAAKTIKPIVIGDFCFLPLDTVIYPGVTIGDGVVARVGTHIHKDVPPFCQIAGNPMRIVRKLSVPEELKDFVGEDRFHAYLQSHAMLEL